MGTIEFKKSVSQTELYNIGFLHEVDPKLKCILHRSYKDFKKAYLTLKHECKVFEYKYATKETLESIFCMIPCDCISNVFDLYDLKLQGKQLIQGS